MGDLHGGGHPVPLLGLPVLTQGDEHAGVPVALVGVVVVGEEDLFELALVGEKRLGGGEEEPCQGAIAGQGTPGGSGQGLLSLPAPPWLGGPSWEVRVSRLSQGEERDPASPQQLLLQAPARHLGARTVHPHCVRLETAVLPTGTCPGGSRQQLPMAPLTHWQVTAQGWRERWPCLGPGPLLWAGWAPQVA